MGFAVRTRRHRQVVASEAGFSLPAILVLIGVLVSILAGGAAYFANQNKEARRLKLRLEAADLVEEIKAALSDSAVCAENFQNKVLSPGSVNSGQFIEPHGSKLTDGTQDILKVGESVQRISGGLIVDRIQVYPVSYDAGVFNGNLLISFRMNDLAGGEWTGETMTLQTGKEGVYVELATSAGPGGRRVDSCTIKDTISSSVVTGGYKCDAPSVMNSSNPMETVIYCPSPEDDMLSGSGNCHNANLGSSYINESRPIKAADGRWGWRVRCGESISGGAVTALASVTCCRFD